MSVFFCLSFLYLLSVFCLFSVFRIVNETSTTASRAHVIDQLLNTNSCTTNVECTEAGLNNRANVPSKVCALQCHNMLQTVPDSCLICCACFFKADVPEYRVTYRSVVMSVLGSQMGWGGAHN